jgi:hypothetical protein
MFQRSNNPVHAKLLTGLNGGNAYCVAYDFFSKLMFGVTLKGEMLPLTWLTWLNALLTRIAPASSVTWRIDRMDLDDETGQHPDMQALLDHHGYITQLNGDSASSQNGEGEHPHHMIGNAVRSMLHSAGLPPKHWGYVFYFFSASTRYSLMAQTKFRLKPPFLDFLVTQYFVGSTTH